MQEPPSTALAGMNHRRPSPTWTKRKRKSQRSALKYLTRPFQLRFPLGGHRDLPPLTNRHRRRLHLHPHQAIAEVRHEIDVRAVADGHEDLRAVPDQPAHG